MTNVLIESNTKFARQFEDAVLPPDLFMRRPFYHVKDMEEFDKMCLSHILTIRTFVDCWDDLVTVQDRLAAAVVVYRKIRSIFDKFNYVYEPSEDYQKYEGKLYHRKRESH